MSFNLVKVPELNPIELVFGLLKNSFRRLKLNLYQNNRRLGTRRMINYAIDALRK
jgi:hypothetical protein